MFDPRDSEYLIPRLGIGWIEYKPRDEVLRIPRMFREVAGRIMGHAEQDIYEEFADKYDRQGDARQRDLFLVLAADAAYTASSADQADRLRRHCWS